MMMYSVALEQAAKAAKNLVLAKEWYEKAAARGDGIAQQNLSVCLTEIARQAKALAVQKEQKDKEKSASSLKYPNNLTQLQTTTASLTTTPLATNPAAFFSSGSLATEFASHATTSSNPYIKI